MSDIFESIMTGLSEAVEDSKSQKKALPRRVVSVIPPKEYSSRQVKEIRKSTGMSQSIFASYLGVSVKTVEAWEAGRNHPSGAASRFLQMMELNKNLTEEFPFVKLGLKKFSSFRQISHFYKVVPVPVFLRCDHFARANKGDKLLFLHPPKRNRLTRLKGNGAFFTVCYAEKVVVNGIL